jgi:hypothetical protein
LTPVGWGLINATISDNWIGNAYPKYFVLAQYTRHIRPGMTIIESGDGNSVAAYDQGLRKLVIVTINYGTAQTITYNLSNFLYAAGPVTRWITQTSGQTEYAQASFSLPEARWFQSDFPTNTITTFEIQNVDLLPSLSASLNGAQQQIVMTWPIWATNYNLFYATSLSSPVQWFAVTNSPQNSGGLFSVNLSNLVGHQRFFRLAAP